MTTKAPLHEWHGILSNGEHILWQGAPDGGFHVAGKNIFGILFGLFFAGIAMKWIIAASQAGGSFWTFGLLHFSIGIGVIVMSLFGDTYKRRHTFYTLTNRNGYVGTNLPFVGRKLKTYPITSATPIGYAPARFATIHFATKEVRTKNGTRTVDVGFERISDGAEVYSLMRSIQDTTSEHAS